MTGHYDKEYKYSDYSFDRKHFCIIVDYWRIYVRTDSDVIALLDLVHKLYCADIISFRSIKDITISLFVQDTINKEITTNKRKLITDILTYEKPCKIRQKVFDYINGIPEQYWIDHDAAKIRSIKQLAPRLANEKYLFNNNTVDTVRDLKIQLLDMINEYDIKNEEDILL